MANLVQEWYVWETRGMVLLSLLLQLFLLLTGSLRQSKGIRRLKFPTWLAYVGADAVAVYALGLFSQYEDKYKSGRQSFGDTLPFLWVPFLLVHLGGQDSITAFSIEDNNLWSRHLLNLVVQGALALYVFWKSFHRISYSILMPAVFIFVAGIIKYGERIWALKSSSRDGLGSAVKFISPGLNNDRVLNYSHLLREAWYAHQIVFLARGLFVGRTSDQLGTGAQDKFRFLSSCHYGTGEVLKITMMELGMMFDLLYTKANVLQRRIGVIFRLAAQIFTVAAFVLFHISEKNAHNRVNVVISYTLFIAAIFSEACSVSAAIASPWTEAHLLHGRCYNILRWLCTRARRLAKAIWCGKRLRITCYMGQFNYMNYCITQKYSKPIVSKAIGAIGLERQWRNLWYVQHVDASDSEEGIILPVLHVIKEICGKIGYGRTRQHQHDTCNLKYTLCLPFEEAIYSLHVCTDLHISRHFASSSSSVDQSAPSVKRLKEECELLSNYMMYLMVVHPSMLPISTAAEDLQPALAKWLENKYRGGPTKLEILREYTIQVLGHEVNFYPFEQELDQQYDLEESLKEIKDVWLRLLIYAAGRCRGELHARQLGDGGELITFVWLLMLHHSLGDMAEELNLNISDSGFSLKLPTQLLVNDSENRTRHQPCYAFDFPHPRQQEAAAVPSSSREAGQDEAGTSEEITEVAEQQGDEAGAN